MNREIDTKGLQMNYGQYNAMLDTEKQNLEKYEQFKERIKEFETVSTLDEAKSLAEKILPVAKEISSFRVGSAKCTVINREDSFRICVDTVEEFISYDFV